MISEVLLTFLAGITTASLQIAAWYNMLCYIIMMSDRLAWWWWSSVRSPGLLWDFFLVCTNWLFLCFSVLFLCYVLPRLRRRTLHSADHRPGESLLLYQYSCNNFLPYRTLSCKSPITVKVNKTERKKTIIIIVEPIVNYAYYNNSEIILNQYIKKRNICL